MKFAQLYLWTFLLCGYGQAQTAQPKNDNVYNTVNPVIEKPKYELTVTAETPYRIFINDIPLLSSEKPGTIKIPINTAIASSGPQQIRVLKQKNNEDSKLLDVSVFVSGQTSSIWKSDLKGKNIENGEFQAKVTYSVYDWSNSATIKQEDSEKMEKAKLWFNQMVEYLKSGKGEEFMQRLVPAEKNTFKANYLDPAMAIGYHDGWKDYISKGGISLSDLRTSHMEIVGNGKLLHMVNDIGEGALAISHGKRKTIFDIFLHFENDKAEPQAILFNLVEY